jgi:tRNA threonylcarbamoyl adenosine modification protein (Sua5/YciO/YrdC/YwlC family)
MMIELFSTHLDDRKIKQIVEVLNKGGVIIYPTDTVYSFGCSLEQPKAMEKIARLKGIKPEKANFSIIFSNLSHLADYSKPLDNAVYKLMKSVLPGPYTFILEANRNIPRLFSSNKKTIGIRMPDNAIARALVDALGCPLIATSVHDDNAILDYTTEPAMIDERWGNLVDVIVDGGVGGLEPSTIIDCTAGKVTLVRQGKGSIEGVLDLIEG